AQDHRRHRRHPARRGKGAAARKPRGEARLGLRARLRGRRVADGPARGARRLRAGHGRDAFRAGVPRGGVHVRRSRLAGVREDRSAILSSCRGRSADWRLCEGEGEARLGADRPLRRARADDGRRRPVMWARDDAKLDRVRSLMEDEGLHALVVRAPDNVLYLTNFWSMKGYDACVFPREAEPVLICLEASQDDAIYQSWTTDIRLVHGYSASDPRPVPARTLDTALAAAHDYG